MSSYQYDSGFFDFVDISSGRSATAFLAQVADSLAPRSVLDVGCGRGVWLAAWRKRGISDTIGVDGDYVERARLQIPQESFAPNDISQPFDLARTFDLVECLEVAEHLPAQNAETLIDNLTRHGKCILFSAAIPGQGGEFHVNEQPLSYWADKFFQRGYRAFDYPRQRIHTLIEIEPWYRFNTILYVHETIVASLPEIIRKTEVAKNAAFPVYGSLTWRLRCGVLRLLPPTMIHRLAQIKHYLLTRKAHA